MSIASPEWVHCVSRLMHAPDGTFDHKLGDTLASATTDQAYTVLCDIITEDPYGTHEYDEATHMLTHLAAHEVPGTVLGDLAALAEDLRWEKNADYAGRLELILSRITGGAR